MGLKRPTSTARIIAALENGYIDPYEPGTRRERVYISSISSIYQEDSIQDIVTIAATSMEDTIVVEILDKEWNLDDLEV